MAMERVALAAANGLIRAGQHPVVGWMLGTIFPKPKPEQQSPPLNEEGQNGVPGDAPVHEGHVPVPTHESGWVMVDAEVQGQT